MQPFILEARHRLAAGMLKQSELPVPASRSAPAIRSRMHHLKFFNGGFHRAEVVKGRDVEQRVALVSQR
jgi:hypothetical protein